MTVFYQKHEANVCVYHTCPKRAEQGRNGGCPSLQHSSTKKSPTFFCLSKYLHRHSARVRYYLSVYFVNAIFQEE
jgi:hypothetical protein